MSATAVGGIHRLFRPREERVAVDPPHRFSKGRRVARLERHLCPARSPNTPRTLLIIEVLRFAANVSHRISSHDTSILSLALALAFIADAFRVLRSGGAEVWM